jgi:hypothetical protein
VSRYSPTVRRMLRGTYPGGQGDSCPSEALNPAFSILTVYALGGRAVKRIPQLIGAAVRFLPCVRSQPKHSLPE